MITLASMGGIAPKVTPELLPGNMAQSAINAILHKGGVAPLKDPVVVATPSKSGIKKTIYRFGIAHAEDAYWFTWGSEVHACRGPVNESTERTYYTGDGTPKKTDFLLATGSGTSYPVVSYELGVPAPTIAPYLSRVAGAGGPTIPEDRAYVYTHVTGWGEESAPSPAGIGMTDSGYLLSLSGFATPPTGSYNITSRRIYRTVTSSAGTNYYFIAQLPLTTTSFLDNVDIAAVGEPLTTLDWDVPPSDLHGLIALPSGALCGISGKQICFSVIGAPYAWPQKYRLTCEYTPVAVAPMGQGVVVLTNGYPYLINTGDPESAQMLKMPEEQACVSQRSVVAFQGSVIYASPDGLVSLSPSGTKIITDPIYDRESWQATNPGAMFAAKHDNRYYGFYDGGGGFALDLAGNFVPHAINATAAYVDPVLDQLYIAAGVYIKKWNSGSALTASWKSKRYNLPQPTNYGCFQLKANSFANTQVKATAYLDSAAQAQAMAAASGNRLVANGNAVTYTTTVTNNKIQRLPGGFLSQLWEFEVSGTDHWTLCAFSNTAEELKGV